MPEEAPVINIVFAISFVSFAYTKVWLKPQTDLTVSTHCLYFSRLGALNQPFNLRPFASVCRIIQQVYRRSKYNQIIEYQTDKPKLTFMAPLCTQHSHH